MDNENLLKYKKAWSRQRVQEARAIRSIRRAFDDHPLVNPSQKESIVNHLVSVGIAGMIFAGACIAGCHEAHAEIPEEKAVKCILGESAGEGEDGMRLIASALRNRGTTKGVYGIRYWDRELRVMKTGCQKKFPKNKKSLDWCNDLSDKNFQAMTEIAQKAWRESKHTDLVKGATFWGSKHVDGAWITKMRSKSYIKTCELKGHEFYRKVRRSKVTKS